MVNVQTAQIKACIYVRHYSLQATSHYLANRVCNAAVVQHVALVVWKYAFISDANA